jgi:uncharacterized protein (TIRG00374 family)
VSRRIQLLFFILGAGVFSVLIYTIGPAQLAADIARIGWMFVPIIGLWFVIFAAHAGAWEVLLAAEPDHPPFWRVWQITVSGFAMNFVTPFAAVGGEPYRVVALSPWLGTQRATGAVILYFMLHAVTSLMLWTAALLLALVAPNANTVTMAGSAMGLAIIGTLGLVLWRAHAKGGFEIALDMLAKVPLLRRLAHKLEPNRASLAQIDRHITDFYHRTPGRLRAAIALDLLARAITAYEFVLIGHAFDIPITYVQAVVISGLSALAMNATFYVPYEMGTREGSLFAAYALLGMDPKVGLTAGLVTRVRELCWIALGLGMMLLPHGRDGKGRIGG